MGAAVGESLLALQRQLQSFSGEIDSQAKERSPEELDALAGTYHQMVGNYQRQLVALSRNFDAVRWSFRCALAGFSEARSAHFSCVSETWGSSPKCLATALTSRCALEHLEMIGVVENICRFQIRSVNAVFRVFRQLAIAITKVTIARFSPWIVGGIA